jgi:hypothetical protein
LDEFGAVESAPVFLGFKAKLEDHREGGDPGTASLGFSGAKPDGCEG